MQLFWRVWINALKYMIYWYDYKHLSIDGETLWHCLLCSWHGMTSLVQHNICMHLGLYFLSKLNTVPASCLSILASCNRTQLLEVINSQQWQFVVHLLNLCNIVVDIVLLMGITSQTARFMGPPWGPVGFCQSQMGPMLALSGLHHFNVGQLHELYLHIPSHTYTCFLK